VRENKKAELLNQFLDAESVLRGFEAVFHVYHKFGSEDCGRLLDAFVLNRFFEMPIMELSGFKTGLKVPRVVLRDDISKLLELPENTPIELRDKALVWFFAKSGGHRF